MPVGAGAAGARQCMVGVGWVGQHVHVPFHLEFGSVMLDRSEPDMSIRFHWKSNRFKG